MRPDEIGAALPESEWKVTEITDTHIVSEAWLDSEGRTKIQRRQLIGDEELQAINRHLYETSGRFSQRSAGAIGTPVANIPLSVLYNDKSEIAKRIRAGDREHLRWWLNSEAARPFRTHKGRL
jgi:hypothetical protein